MMDEDRTGPDALRKLAREVETLDEMPMTARILENMADAWAADRAEITRLLELVRQTDAEKRAAEQLITDIGERLCQREGESLLEIIDDLMRPPNKHFRFCYVHRATTTEFDGRLACCWRENDRQRAAAARRVAQYVWKLRNEISSDESDIREAHYTEWRRAEGLKDINGQLEISLSRALDEIRNYNGGYRLAEEIQAQAPESYRLSVKELSEMRRVALANERDAIEYRDMYESLCIASQMYRDERDAALARAERLAVELTEMSGFVRRLRDGTRIYYGLGPYGENAKTIYLNIILEKAAAALAQPDAGDGGREGGEK